jgi:hypothetical protein
MTNLPPIVDEPKILLNRRSLRGIQHAHEAPAKRHDMAARLAVAGLFLSSRQPG